MTTEARFRQDSLTRRFSVAALFFTPTETLEREARTKREYLAELANETAKAYAAETNTFAQHCIVAAHQELMRIGRLESARADRRFARRRWLLGLFGV